MRKANGVSLVYMLVIMSVMCMFASLAVDLGRVQIAKVEMHRAVDSAARAGAAGLATDTTTALQQANYYANHNYVDGATLSLIGNATGSTSDIQVGTWSTASHTFKQLFGDDRDGGNAVRILGHRGTDRGNAIPISFAVVKNFRSCQVNAEAIAMLIPPVSVDQNVPATANPFLAGAAAGTEASNVNPHNNPDYAGTASDPRQSPLAVAMKINGGDELTFASIDGKAQHDPTLGKDDPDGQTGVSGTADIGHNNLTTDGNNSYGSKMYNQNGIADMTAPIDALVGVFLDDSNPASSKAPSNLDFSTAGSRDFTKLEPQLKQIFFIGDGLNSKNVAQKFVAPKGATRLFLATWDFYEWNNNSGQRNIKVNRPMVISLVK